MSLLEIENVTLRFGGLVAVDNVSLKVNEGEVFALVGPNGAGKSTIFNLISRFYDPAEGSIRFEGNDLLKSNADQVPSFSIARTFQNIELFEQATVLQNLLVGRHRHRQQTRSGQNPTPAHVGLMDPGKGAERPHQGEQDVGQRKSRRCTYEVR